MKSIIWTMPKSDLSKIVKSSGSYAEILRKLGLTPGNTTVNLKHRCEIDAIDYTHLKNGQGMCWNKGKHLVNKDETMKLFCRDSKADRQSIKRYVIRFQLMEYKCVVCGQRPNWNGKEMTLILDHKNGIRNDHRVENLQFVCPNCNSQLPTTCRNNTKRITWNVKELKREISNGKSIRKCLLDRGLSDGTNYNRVKRLLLK